MGVGAVGGSPPTLNEALGQTFETEAVKVVVAFSDRLQKMREWTLWSWPPPKRKKRRHKHSPSEKKEIVTSVGYSGQAALRREQCAMQAGKTSIARERLCKHIHC
jgi:hypothetical protein